MSERAKIAEQHRRRRAVVYVRQSTLAQVASNVESAARQYALVERAVELGWPREAVAVVDEDSGRSGASSEERTGFKELAASVGLGEIGLILALEVSRLARSSADWHRLLDLCALTGTLIADQDGVYSPGDFNDRLLLGLKGTMSEAELHLIRARLDGGLRHKAERGELALSLPVGLDRDEEGRVVLSADEQVRAAIARVFSLWWRLGSARQVVSELIAAGERLPRRTVGERRIRWARPSYGAVHDLLTNPCGSQKLGSRLQIHGVAASAEFLHPTAKILTAPANELDLQAEPNFWLWGKEIRFGCRLGAVFGHLCCGGEGEESRSHPGEPNPWLRLARRARAAGGLHSGDSRQPRQTWHRPGGPLVLGTVGGELLGFRVAGRFRRWSAPRGHVALEPCGSHKLVRRFLRGVRGWRGRSTRGCSTG